MWTLTTVTACSWIEIRRQVPEDKLVAACVVGATQECGDAEACRRSKQHTQCTHSTTWHTWLRVLHHMPQAFSSRCALHSSISLQLDLYNYLQGYAMRAAETNLRRQKRSPVVVLAEAWSQPGLNVMSSTSSAKRPLHPSTLVGRMFPPSHKHE